MRANAVLSVCDPAFDLSGSHGMKFSFQQDISEEEYCA